MRLSFITSSWRANTRGVRSFFAKEAKKLGCCDSNDARAGRRKLPGSFYFLPAHFRHSIRAHAAASEWTVGHMRRESIAGDSHKSVDIPISDIEVYRVVAIFSPHHISAAAANHKIIAIRAPHVVVASFAVETIVPASAV